MGRTFLVSVESTIAGYLRAATGNLTVIGRHVCTPSTQLQVSADLMAAKIRSKYLWRSNFTLALAVRASGCGGGGGKVKGDAGGAPWRSSTVKPPGDKDLVVDIILSGTYRCVLFAVVFL